MKKTPTKIKIGVLFGGRSVEHDVSIISAIQIMHAIDQSIFEVIPIYISKDNYIYTNPAFIDLSTFKAPLDYPKLKPNFIIRNTTGFIITPNPKKPEKGLKIDLILPILHGQGVEDGIIASLLDFIGGPHTLSSHTASAILQDKEYSKLILKEYGIKVLPCKVVKESDYIKSLGKIDDLNYPLIIKPAHLGSSIGISVINGDDLYKSKELKLKEGLELAFNYDDKVIIEPALSNFKEFSCAIYQTDQVYLSLIEEIKVNHFFDFKAKYEEEGKNQSHQVPADIDEKLADLIKEYTKRSYQIFDLQGIVRVDYLYDLDSKTLYLNEINTIPGSLAFHLYQNNLSGDDGLFTNILTDIIKHAIFRYQYNSEKVTTFDSSILSKNSFKK